MNTHPDYYTDLLRRRCKGDPSLTHAQQREMDLHLLICLACNFEYIQRLAEHAPQAAMQLQNVLERRLSPDVATPFLRPIALAMQNGEPLTAFQQWLMQFVRHDAETSKRFWLIQADTQRHTEL